MFTGKTSVSQSDSTMDWLDYGTELANQIAIVPVDLNIVGLEMTLSVLRRASAATVEKNRQWHSVRWLHEPGS